MTAKPNTCPHCGCEITQALGRTHKRSGPQHRRFFAICRAAFLHWPDYLAFRPRSESHLRYWLEMRADHATVTTTARIQSADPDKVFALVNAFMRNSEDERLFIELDGELLIQKRTLSIDYDTLGPAEFGRLKDAVCEIIEAEVGIPAERLLKETEAAA